MARWRKFLPASMVSVVMVCRVCRRGDGKKFLCNFVFRPLRQGGAAFDALVRPASIFGAWDIGFVHLPVAADSPVSLRLLDQ